MAPESTQQSQRTDLLGLFNLQKAPACLDGLRAPAGSFNLELALPLAQQGLIKFDTETGIIFQTWEEWNITLTQQGRDLLASPPSQSRTSQSGSEQVPHNPIA